MQLVLNPEQKLLQRTASEVVRERSPVSRFRKLRDDGEELGFSPELWSYLAELGWTAIPFDEADGGMGMGLAEVVIVMEQLGRGLAPEPYLGNIMLGAQALALGGDADQRRSWMPLLIDGSRRIALAYQERGSRYDVTHVRTMAAPTAQGHSLSGKKQQVLGGVGADAFVVSARTGDLGADVDGITCFLVPADRQGVRVVRQSRLDCHNAAIVELDGVEVSAADAIGEPDRGGALLQRVIDRATVALCGEMLGGMNEALERTLDYLRERAQFGVIIGTFQALKHRAARLFVEGELARSAVMAAARAIDEQGERDPEAQKLVCIAKARCSDAYLATGHEAVQLHGGIGMTDEHDIGFFLKRARAAELTFGDAAHHRDRFARLSGF